MNHHDTHRLQFACHAVRYSNRARFGLSAGVVAVVALLLGPLAATTALADATDIATQPVFATVSNTTSIKPNIMLLIDNSGSMASTYMPDEANDFSGSYGYVSSQCNGLYYNPSITYTPPVNAAGTSYANQSFTAAMVDGYGVTSTSTTNLSTSFNAGYSGASNAAAYYYKYTGTQTTEPLKNYFSTSSTFYTECDTGLTKSSSVFTKVTVSSTSGPGSTDERTNFANWYSYYRTRLNMMKTATSLAFESMTEDYRIGFMALNNVNNAFLNVSDFNTTQKSNFYSMLLNLKTSGSTPLRQAVSVVGRMYANKMSSINGVSVVDPVQYSCQQNYLIMSTDGYWNGSNGVQLDGSTAIGNQDNTLARPYNDGSKVTTTTVTPYTSTQNWETVTNIGTVTKSWTRTNTTIGTTCTASVPPSNTTSAPLATSVGYLTALGTTNANDTCYTLGSGAYYCRGTATTKNNRTTYNSPSVSSSYVTATGTNGTTWYLVSDTSGNSGCVTAYTAFGSSTTYSSKTSTMGVCPSQSTAGKSVTVTPQTQTETITAYSSTQDDLYTAIQTTTQVTTNGVAGTTGALTPSTPSYSYTSTTSFNQTNGGDTYTAWVDGSPTTSCVATASLPTAGVSTATSSTVNTGTTTTVTKSQLTTAVVGTPTVTSVGAGGVANTLADATAYYYYTDLRTSALGNCTGVLGTGSDVCANNGTTTTDDPVAWQHMLTFTVGLGVRGKMVFNSDYKTSTSTNSDYAFVKNGSTPQTGTNSTTNTYYCTWRDTLTTTGGTCNWPYPNAVDNVNNSDETSTDDLWHAAVNGHGTYFSATDPSSLSSGLSSTLKKITNTPRPGTASAAATTNPKVTQDNNYQFSSYFQTVNWSGELIRQTMDLTTGAVPTYDPLNPDPATYDWSAQTQLDAKTYTNRTIYTSNGSSLVAFTWGNLSTAQQAYFKQAYVTSPDQHPTALPSLTQFCVNESYCLSSTAQSNNTVATGGAAGEALVNFIRGDRSNEGNDGSDLTKFYRTRKHVLGDIVSAQPLYVGAPNRSYSDAGYADFKTAQASRTPMVYAAANDGMLHAFTAGTASSTDTSGGAEAWAYIPSFVLPRLYTLADRDYQHEYSVEGSPAYGDICPKAPSASCSSSQWKTILVGGLNAGGTGYYALDVTDPANPKLLWEFTDANMGFSFGRPQLTKLSDGTWVVMVASGYNNCPWSASQTGCVGNGTGDGVGRLYILNAATGAQITGSPISTGVGSTTNPSGLAQIVAHTSDSANNTANYVYGGDLLGNVWRFNVTVGSFAVHDMAILKDSTGVVQPVTSRPVVTTINGTPVIYVGTGRYLGSSDVGTSPKNSFYALKDDQTNNPTYNNPHSYGYDSTCTSTGTGCNYFAGYKAVDGTCPTGTDTSICESGQTVRMLSQTVGRSTDSLTTANVAGWYMDFPDGAGEIEFTDAKLISGTLAFSTSIPTASSTAVCDTSSGGSEGTSFAYMVNYLTGGTVGTTSGVIGTSLGSGVATAAQISILPDGTVIAKYRLSTGSEVSQNLRFDSTGAGTKRISWRELVTE